MELPKLTEPIKEKDIHTAFEIALVLKGINAAGEILSGILVFFVPKDLVLNVVLRLTQGELIEEPQDKVANFLIHAAQQYSITSQSFIAFYLLFHGAVKLFLIYNLLKNRLWAYPVSIVVFALFIAYQIFRFTITHSPWLLWLTIFDVIIIWLTWHEYRYMSRKA